MTDKLSANFKLAVLQEAKKVSTQLGQAKTKYHLATSTAIAFANVADKWRTNRRSDYDAVDTPAVLKGILCEL